MKKWFLACVLFFSHLSASVDSSSDIKIKSLIPKGWIAYPAIDPALPDDYEAAFDEMGLHAFWGKPADLELALKGEMPKIKHPLFMVNHSMGLAQTGPDSFSDDEVSEKDAKQAGFEDFKTERLKWGSYPVRTFKGTLKGECIKLRVAWIGLNNPDGHVLQVSLFEPREKEAETISTEDVWRKFLTKTSELSDYTRFKCLGMDMRDGYTIYESGDVQLKVFAEKRKSDGKVFFAIEPLNEYSSFDHQDVFEAQMGTEWKYGSPCLKISGLAKYVKEGFSSYVGSTVTVLLKEVDSFSEGKDWMEKRESVAIPSSDSPFGIYQQAMEEDARRFLEQINSEKS